MHPQPDIYSLFVPLLITLSLVCTLALQFAFNGDDF